MISGFVKSLVAILCGSLALLIAGLGIQTPAALAEKPRSSNLVAEGRIHLPDEFYEDGDLFRLKSDQNWYSMFFRSQGSYETWDEFARGYQSATGKHLSGIEEIVVETVANMLALGMLNNLKAEVAAKGYDAKFIVTPSNQGVFPIETTFENMCAYYAYEISGVSAPKAFPGTYFTTRSHSLICAIYDYDRARFHVDVLTLSERHAPFKGAVPVEDLESLAAKIFSTLLPPPEFR